MLERQRFAVHGHREDGVQSVVGERTQRGGCREPVDALGEHHVGVALRRGQTQHVADGDALPDRIADEASTDLVRHAREGHAVLVQAHGDEIVEGQLDGLVDHALDAQTPRGRVDVRHGEGGVDTVEIGVRRDDRRQARDVERRPLGHGDRAADRGKAQRIAGGGNRRGGGVDDARTHTHHDGGRGGDAGEEEEAAAVDAGRGRVAVGGRSGPPPQTTAQQEEEHDADHGAEHGRQPGERGRTRARDDGGGGQRPADAEKDRSDRAEPVLDDPGDRGRDSGAEPDAGEQRDLVGLAEHGDRELLQRAGHDVDDERAHRQHGARGSGHEHREQFGDGEQGRGRDESREGGPEPRPRTPDAGRLAGAGRGVGGHGIPLPGRRRRKHRPHSDIRSGGGNGSGGRVRRYAVCTRPGASARAREEPP